MEMGKRIWVWGKVMKAVVLISWGEGFCLRVNLRGTIKLWKREDGEMKCRLLQPRTWGKWERKAELM